jgi:trans-aconitate 2-methyltransferase
MRKQVPQGQQNWNAGDYAKHSSAQLAWAQELMGKLALKGTESVLDIGCGDGKISALLAHAVPEGTVLGIDLSADMIGHARAQYPPKDYPNLSFLQMDATNIHIPDKQFNLAFSTATLHWIKDHIAILLGVRAHLRPDGRILFQMGGRGNGAEVFDIAETVLHGPRWKRYFEDFTPPYHFYGPEHYEAWLPRCGFRPLRIELFPKDMRHTLEGFSGWLRTTWFPLTDRLPEELRSGLLSEMADAFIKAHPLDSEGTVHVRMVRLEVEAIAV